MATKKKRGTDLSPDDIEQVFTSTPPKNGKGKSDKALADAVKGYDEKDALIDNSLLRLDIEDTDVEMAMALENTSPKEIQKQTQRLLKERREQLTAKLDMEKLRQLQVVMDAQRKITGVMVDESVWNNIINNTTTARDLKLLAETYYLLQKATHNLVRPDSLDAQGTAKRLNIGVQYKDTDGSSASVIISKEG